MTPRIATASIAVLVAGSILVVHAAPAELDNRVPSTSGNGRVYVQKELVVGSDLMRFTARDAGPSPRKGEAELGARILEVVRCKVGPNGSESDARVIYRELLAPGTSGASPGPWYMDLLVDESEGNVFLAKATEIDFFVVAFKIDATPVARDGRPDLDKPLAPDVKQTDAEAAHEAAMKRHRWLPRPTFEPAKVFAQGIRHVRLDLDDAKLILTLRNDDATARDLKLVYSANH